MADLVIRAGTWVCVQTGEFVEKTDIAIKDGRIAYIGSDASHCIQKETRIIEANGRYLVPGLLDAHVHIESSMLSVTEFVRAVVSHGTTGIFIDPHEIANVSGLQGIRWMVDEAKKQPIHVWVQVPSCVPASPEFATSGVSLDPGEIKEALSWEGVIGLGEVMDYFGVINNDPKLLLELDESRRSGKVIGGHYASLDLGLPFHGYIAGGAEDDHEGTTTSGAIARARQGLKVMVRYGSAWQDVIEQIKAITDAGLDSRRFLLCTDDSHAETLVQEGHMDRVIRHAIQHGLPPMTAIQMATINSAEHFGLSRDLGLLAPGRWADVVLVEDLEEFQASTVIVKGIKAAENGTVLLEDPGTSIPEWIKNSVSFSRNFTANDFKIFLDDPLAKAEKIHANVIGIVENQAYTRHLKLEVKSHSNDILADKDNDISKLALIERHLGTQKVQMGLVNGFGFDTNCAVATTVAHDSHQMLVVGSEDACMAAAANHLHQYGGGQVVVKEGQVIGFLELPIAGLMSPECYSVVAKKAATILDGFRSCGCKLKDPNMLLSLLALVVIPELRLSDHGLLDVNDMKVIPLFEEPQK
jgi:adenine deaminase